ncbi:MAG: tetratricopeptide repeat protein, partial [Bacteroidota bacterium]
IARHRFPKSPEDLVKSLITYVGDKEKWIENAAIWNTLLPHGRQLYKWLDKEKHPVAAQQLASQLFEACGVVHAYEESKEWALKSLAVIDAHPTSFELKERAYANSVVGASFSRLVSYEEALPYKNKALDIYKTLYPQGHGEIVNAQRSVGELHSYLGKQEEARKNFQEALDMCDQLLDKSPEDRFVLKTKARLLNGMGVSFDKEHNYKAALPHKRDSLALNQDLYKDASDHPAVGHSLHGLGETLIRTGKRENLAAGLDYCKKALALREQLDKNRGGGDEHTANSQNWVGIALTQLGQAEQDSKKVEEGLEHSKKALKTFDTIYPNQGHPYIVPTLRNIVQSIKYLKSEAGLEKYEKRLKALTSSWVYNTSRLTLT